MIDFSKVEQRNWLYEALYIYVRFVHNHIYYKSYQIRGIENIPDNDEPFMVICNHQNGLNDALGILFALHSTGRRPVFIARGDIFQKTFVAKLLRFVRIMPAFRVRDTGMENLGENDAIFNRSADILNSGGIIAMFPEAGHEDCHHLGTFKKGFSRIAFKAVEDSDFQLKLKVLPFSNHYSNYFHLQSKLAITIGEPFTFDELYDLYKEHPQRARTLLADKARKRVKGMMLDIEDKAFYTQYDILRHMYAKQAVKNQGGKTSYYPNLLDAERDIVARIDCLRKEDENSWKQLMNKALTYKSNLVKLNLRDWIFRTKITLPGILLRFLLLIVLFPICLYSFINNILPYEAGYLITRKVKDKMLHSSFHFGLGVLITFPLWYLSWTIITSCLSGLWWIGLLYLLTAPLSLVFFFKTKVFIIKLYNRIRRFRFKITKNSLLQETEQLHTDLMDELEKLMTC